MQTLALALAWMASDPLVLVQYFPSDPKAAYFATLHPVTSAVGAFDQMGPVTAGYANFYSGTGKQRLHTTFAADVDGNGVDEICVVREKVKTKTLGMLVLPMPSKYQTKKPKPIASTPKAGFAALEGDSVFVAIGRLDLDGDGRDEAAIVTEAEGSLVVAIRRLPEGKKSPFSSPLANITLPDKDPVVAAFGLPFDATDGDELVLIRRTDVGDRISIHPIESSGASILAAASLTDLIPSPPDMILTRASASRVGVDEGPGITLVFEASGTGAPSPAARVERRPCAVVVGLGAPIQTQEFQVAGPVAFDAFAASISGPTDPPPPPNPGESGTWNLTFGYTTQQPDGSFVDNFYFGFVPSPVVFDASGAIAQFIAPLTQGGSPFDVSFALPGGTTLGAPVFVNPGSFDFLYMTTPTAPNFTASFAANGVAGAIVESLIGGPFAIRIPSTQGLTVVGSTNLDGTTPPIHWFRFEKAP